MAQQLWLIFSGTYATFSILNRGSVMADLLIRLCHIRQMVRWLRWPQPGFSNQSPRLVESGWVLVTTITRDDIPDVDVFSVWLFRIDWLVAWRHG